MTMKKSSSPPRGNPTAQKLARLRVKKKITLEALSEKTGLTVKDLENIESGSVFPPVGDILKISRALTVDPDQLLSRDDKDDRELKKKRVDDFNKRAASYMYTILTPDAHNKHLRAFRITIPAGEEHPKISYQHEGEEFVYVLEGQVDITVGKKKTRLKEKGTLHFDSGVKHALRNPGKTECVLLVTVYTP